VKRLRLGTRGSRLARIQSGLIAERLRRNGVEVEMVTIVTAGDLRPTDAPIDDGVFVRDIEQALLAREIDLAVHSAKDLPLELHPALPIVAYPQRADPRDALVTRGGESWLEQLEQGARVGTDSARRTAFVRAIRPDLEVIALLGNVDWRVERLDAGEADALVLAAAGLDRLGLGGRIAMRFAPELMPPAPAQGALAVQARGDDQAVLAAVRAIDDAVIRLAVVTERAVMRAVGGGCRVPIGAVVVRSRGGYELVAGASTPTGESTHVLKRRFRANKAHEIAALASGVAAELVARVHLRTRAVLDTRPELDPVAAALLDKQGLRVVHAPTVAIAPLTDSGELDRVRAHLGDYDWVVLTSKRGVDALFNTQHRIAPASVRWAAVGPVTARALRNRGVEVDAQPAVAVGDAIPAAMAERGPLRGARVLLARADAASQALPELLRGRGVHVDDVVAYRSIAAPAGSRERVKAALTDPELEAVVFASRSAVRGLAALAGESSRRLKAFTIGPKTSAAARELGFAVAGEAMVTDARGLTSAVKRGFDEEVTTWVESQLAI
jgi:hydroxymethylbilane synthase